MCLSAVCLSVPYVIYLLFRQLAVIVLTVILGVTILGVHGVIKVCCGGRSLEGTAVREIESRRTRVQGCIP